MGLSWVIPVSRCLSVMCPDNKFAYLSAVEAAVRSGIVIAYKIISALDEDPRRDLLLLLGSLPHDKVLALLNDVPKNKILKNLTSSITILGRARALGIIKGPEFSEPWTWQLLTDALTLAAETLQQDASGDNLRLEQERFCPQLPLLKEQTLPENHKIVMPETAGDLVVWGTALDNCIGNGTYVSRAALGRSLLLGVADSEGQIRYAVEISPTGALVQAKGVRNDVMPKHMKAALTKVLGECGIFKASAGAS